MASDGNAASPPPPAWVRRIVIRTSAAPLYELKAQIKTEAQALPSLLRLNGGVGIARQREALLSLELKSARVRSVCLRGTFDELPDILPADLRDALLTEIASLPAALDGGSEAQRTYKLFRVETFCHRLLATLLATLLFSCCSLCHMTPLAHSDHIDITAQSY